MGGVFKKESVEKQKTSEQILAETISSNPYLVFKSVDKRKIKKKLYEPFEIVPVQNHENFILALCSITDLDYKIFEYDHMVLSKFHDESNPYQMLVHYIHPKHTKQSDSIKKFIPLHKEISFYADYYNESLFQQLNAFKKLNDQDLWLLFDCITECMYLQQKDKYYQQGIHSKMIFAVDTPFNKKVFKIFDGLLNREISNKFHVWREDYLVHQLIDHNTLFDVCPPQHVLDLIKKLEKFPQINYYKLDVFSFGMLMLQCHYTQEILEYIYDNVKLILKEDYLQDLISKLPAKYIDLITGMLDPNEETRLDWIEIKAIMDQCFQGERICSQYQYKDFIYEYQFSHPPAKIQSKQEDIDSHQEFYLEMDLPKEPSDLSKTIQKQEVIFIERKKHHQQELAKQSVIISYLKVKQNLQIIKTQVQNIRRSRLVNFDKSISLEFHVPAEQKEKLKRLQIPQPIYLSKDGQKLELTSIVDDERNTYRGQTFNNRKHGFGEIYNSKDILIYRGQFENDLFNGDGYLINPNVEQVQQNTQASVFDKTHYNLEMKLDRWVTYDGSFYSGKRNGKGQIKFKNGSSFQGIFKNDKAEGSGEYTYQDGRVVNGVWSEDQYQLQK